MTNPIWNTPSGRIGIFPSLIPVTFQLEATPLPPATSLTYQIVNGNLPVGLSLNINGLISGVPGLTLENNTYNFVVRAIDNTSYFKDRSFQIVVSTASTIQFATQEGTIGVFPSLIPLVYQIQAVSILPATTITYEIISGSLPNGLTIDIDGLITGIPELNATINSYQFVIRATDNLNNFIDRTFDITITGSTVPEFTTPAGSLLTTQDSIWTELQIEYNNPLPSNKIYIRVIQGELPPGLEINEYGLIRGYADPPIVNLNLPTILTSITSCSANTNEITGLSTAGFSIGRPIFFTGTVFGGLVESKIYYIHSIINEFNFKICAVPGDIEILLQDGTGLMNATLPATSVGQPTIKTYTFTLKIDSILGSDLQSYSITVVNQNTPVSRGGPGKTINTRIPTVLNTKPATYNTNESVDDYGYYLLPPNSKGVTYPTTDFAYIGHVQSDNYFSFKILGKDFDNSPLYYVYSGLPLELTGDPLTGWITGILTLPLFSIEEYKFSVKVQKQNKLDIESSVFNFSFKLSNVVQGDIVWDTPSNLGEILNATVCVKKVLATADVPLLYRIVNGNLPPNLTLLSNGEITGTTAYQPTNVFLEQNAKTDFTFIIEAYSPEYSVISSVKTFTLTVVQEYTEPTDTLYIKCTPDINDRRLLESLLGNEELIPSEYLYRIEDPNFGKAKSVIYAHAYGINASDFPEYIAAITKNHYWRSLTLGELSTAVARNDSGEIVYEVVYSNVIDNLVNLKTPPQSVSKSIYWPRFIDLELGPWYTSVTNIYTSYESYKGQEIFYTSLTPGYARTLYPNSLPNMRQQIEDVLGQQYDFRLLPNWMTSQQENGSTLGFIPAWVICYTKPGFSKIIKNNIETNWKNELGQVNTLNKINFEIDRFSVDKSITYNYDKNLTPPAWTQLPSATPTPDPIDSKDFYVLFPRETILPDKTQY